MIKKCIRGAGYGEEQACIKNEGEIERNRAEFIQASTETCIKNAKYMVGMVRKFIQAITARGQAEAGAEGQARQSRAEGARARESGAWRSGGREAAEPPTHPASPMVLHCGILWERR